MTTVLSVDLALLQSSDQPRPFRAGAVELIAASMAAVGLIQPVRIMPTKILRGVLVPGYRIVAGHHRVAAARSLGWTHIDAIVIMEFADHLHAELMEIDENLCRSELSAAERTSAIKRRKQIWEALHPARSGGEVEANTGTSCSTIQGRGRPKEFASETAKASGQSKRDINRHLARGESLGDDLEKVVGTSLDKGTELDALSKMEPEQRAELIERAQSGEAVSAAKAMPTAVTRKTWKAPEDITELAAAIASRYPGWRLARA